jgi:hypothetical protein
VAQSKRTFASVTTKPCKCRWPQDVSAEPENGVEFDSRTNEYQLLTRSGGTLILYHCPFCGGAMPRSRRAELFAYITEAERQRLGALTSGLASVDDAIRVLGKPQHDDPTGSGERAPAKGRRASRVTSQRMLTFTRLSKTADVDIIDHGPLGVRVSFRGKYLGKRRGRRTKS